MKSESSTMKYETEQTI